MHTWLRTCLGLGAICLVAGASTAEPNEILQVSWSTDRDPKDVYGHDGPWQAINVPLGGRVQPMLPDPRYMSLVAGKTAGGSYDAGSSPSAVPFNNYTVSPTDFVPCYFFNSSCKGQGFFETLDIPIHHGASTAQEQTTRVSHNATVAVATDWFGNKTPPPEIGILGLGTEGRPPMPDGKPALGLLEAMQRNRSIASNVYSLHLGSATLRQRGSLVLGGYDPKRIAGEVGLFNTASSTWLVDVQMGVAGLGNSPLDGIRSDGHNGSVSIFQGNGGNARADAVLTSENGPPGSVYTLVDSSLPYIYLPLGTCEAAAQLLPVHWDAGLELYIWDTDDPQYARIVGSPAYLGFVMRGLGRDDTTIKIPFALLNLTISRLAANGAAPSDANAENESLTYFPCKPFDAPQGVWLLGRAFLQAAFAMYDLEGNYMFLSQAPGPDMTVLDGSAAAAAAASGPLTAYVPPSGPGNSEGLPPPVPRNAAPAFAWERSWNATWTAMPLVLPVPDDADGRAGGAGEGLSDAAKAGVAVAVAVACMGVAVTGGVLLWRRRRRILDREGLTDLDVRHPDYYEMATGARGGRRREADDDEYAKEPAERRSVAEMYGDPQGLHGENHKLW